MFWDIYKNKDLSVIRLIPLIVSIGLALLVVFVGFGLLTQEFKWAFSEHFNWLMFLFILILIADFSIIGYKEKKNLKKFKVEHKEEVSLLDYDKTLHELLEKTLK